MVSAKPTNTITLQDAFTSTKSTRALSNGKQPGLEHVFNCWCYDLRLDYCTWRGRTGIVLGWLTQVVVARYRFAVVNWLGPGSPRLSFWISASSLFVGSVMTAWAPYWYHGVAPQGEGRCP
ncbi:hypothetical protein FPOAC2_02973 [Fusarium poae]|jgi:hypothetical protein